MKYNEKNLGAAKSIIDILARENCTIEETTEILSYVQRVIKGTSTVQLSDESESMLTFSN